jgi:hypothetical protein
MTLVVGLIIVTSLGAALWVASLWAGSLVTENPRWVALAILVPSMIAFTWITLPSVRRARPSIRISDERFRRTNDH